MSTEKPHQRQTSFQESPREVCQDHWCSWSAPKTFLTASNPQYACWPVQSHQLPRRPPGTSRLHEEARIMGQRLGHVFNTSKCQEASTYPYLGLNISNDLKWSYHINRVCKKASATLDFLRRNLRKTDGLCHVFIERYHLMSHVFCASKMEHSQSVTIVQM